MINRFLVGIEFQSRARCLAFHVAHFFIPFLFSWSQRIDLFAFHVSHTHNHRIHPKIVKLFMFYFMIRFGSAFFALKSTWENAKITKEGASWTNRCQKYTQMYFEVNIFFFLINEINSLFCSKLSKTELYKGLFLSKRKKCNGHFACFHLNN